MTEHTLAADRTPTPTTLAEISGPFFKRRLLAQLTRLRHGHLTLVDGSERYDFGNVGRDDGPRATVRIEDADVYRQMALGGSVGTAEAYMDGAWNCEDLTGLVRIMVRNREVLDGMDAVDALPKGEPPKKPGKIVSAKVAADV